MKKFVLLTAMCLGTAVLFFAVPKMCTSYWDHLDKKKEVKKKQRKEFRKVLGYGAYKVLKDYKQGYKEAKEQDNDH